MTEFDRLAHAIGACRQCADRFAATPTGHDPRPVLWAAPGAPILIASQAPGTRVHASGRPFDDQSGARLRDWIGLDEATFWDRSRVAFQPMAFCFPGQDAKGGDLPPPPICAATWAAPLRAALGPARLTLLVGGAAQRHHLPRALTARGLSATIAGWGDLPADVIALPHPSWRNTHWLKANPWFAQELLPLVKARVRAALADAPLAQPGRGD
jgi:uracil-DNA glycosylase